MRFNRFSPKAMLLVLALAGSTSLLTNCQSDTPSSNVSNTLSDEQKQIQNALKDFSELFQKRFADADELSATIKSSGFHTFDLNLLDDQNHFLAPLKNKLQEIQNAVGQQNVEEARNLMKGIKVGDILPEEGEYAFTKRVKLDTSKAIESGMEGAYYSTLADGPLDIYLHRFLTEQQQSKILGAWFSQADLVDDRVFLKNMILNIGDPTFIQDLQTLGQSSVAERYQQTFNTVFKDMKYIPEAEVKAKLDFALPADRFEYTIKDRIGAGKMGGADWVEVRVKNPKTGKVIATFDAAPKIRREEAKMVPAYAENRRKAFGIYADKTIAEKVKEKYDRNFSFYEDDLKLGKVTSIEDYNQKNPGVWSLDEVKLSEQIKAELALTKSELEHLMNRLVAESNFKDETKTIRKARVNSARMKKIEWLDLGKYGAVDSEDIVWTKFAPSIPLADFIKDDMGIRTGYIDYKGTRLKLNDEQVQMIPRFRRSLHINDIKRLET